MTKDEDHLRLLTIFHYVLAGVTALFSMFPIMHIVMGLAVLSGDFGGPTNGEDFPKAFGWMFVIMGAMAIFFGLSLAVVIALAGRSLQLRRWRVFCLVAAGLMCMMMPLGTVLGVFTIIVLMRDSVKALFEPATGPGVERPGTSLTD